MILSLTTKQARVAIARALNFRTLDTTNQAAEQLVDAVLHELVTEEEARRARFESVKKAEEAVLIDYVTEVFNPICPHEIKTKSCRICNPMGEL